MEGLVGVGGVCGKLGGVLGVDMSFVDGGRYSDDRGVDGWDEWGRQIVLQWSKHVNM